MPAEPFQVLFLTSEKRVASLPRNMKIKFWISALVAPLIFVACDSKDRSTQKMAAGQEKIAEGMKEMTDAAGEKAGQKVDKAREEAKAAMDHVQQEMDKAAAASKAKFDKAVDAAGAAVDQTKEKAGDAATKAKEAVKQAVEDTEDPPAR